MYRILLVDDEIHAVRGLITGLEWERLGISDIFTAHSMRQALQVFEKETIDLMVCDIEMPQGSGLELLEWVREHKPRTETIFLTCHSEFQYAQKAIQLDSFDYLLKPVDSRQLEVVISKALELIRHRQVQEQFIDNMKRSTQRWETNRPLHKELFWRDIIEHKISASADKIEEYADRLNLNVHCGMQILPIHIQIHRWKKMLSLRDRKILEYALKNAAEDMLQVTDEGSAVIPMADNSIYVVIHGCVLHERFEQYVQLCLAYIEACNHYFACDLSCHIGPLVYPQDMARTAEALLQRAREQKSKFNTVTTYHNIENSTDGNTVVDLVKNYIQEHLNNPNLSRTEIAGHVYLNPDYLTRLFKKETGWSISDYRQQQRINYAKQLLQDSMLTISGIALETGYFNISYFSTAFKKLTGVSPIDYRKSFSLQTNNHSVES